MTPRSGSTFLCNALAATGQAGHPEEYYTAPHTEALLERYGHASVADLQATILQQGTGPNGVFGTKIGPGGGGLECLVDMLYRLDGNRDGAALKPLIQAAFPNLKCLFLTRRNKIRQAVSWWKAVRTNQWVLTAEAEPVRADLEAYDVDAISQLVQEAVFREAGWQSFFTQLGLTPHTIVYEDLHAEYEPTLRAVLDFLDLDVPAPLERDRRTRRQADEVSERWVERYRREKQADWNQPGWPGAW